MGLGFVWAWVYGAYNTDALFAEHSLGKLPWLTSGIVVVLSLIAWAFAWRRTDTMQPKKIWRAATGSTLMVVGTLGVELLSRTQTSSTEAVLSLLCSCMNGIGYAWLCILWGCALARLDVERLEVAVPCACVVTMACSVVLPSLAAPWDTWAVALLPALSGAFLLWEGREATHEPIPPLPAKSKSQPPQLVLTGLSVVMVYAAIGFIDTSCQAVVIRLAGFDVDVPTFVGSSLGIAMVVGTVLFSIKIGFSGLYRWLIPLLVASAALCAMGAAGSMLAQGSAIAIVDGADMCLQAVVYLSAFELARSGFVSAAMGIGLGQAAIQLGVLVGHLGARAMEDTASDPLGMAFVALGMAVLLSVARSLLPQQAFWPASKRDTQESQEESDTSPALQWVAGTYGLSARETQVLAYLAKGRTQPYIRDELQLSKSTVSTHVKHIYQKLGVHSKQELIDLCDAARRRS